MNEDKKKDATSQDDVENKDESTEDKTDDAEEESSEESEESEDDDKSEDTDNEIDYDAEIEAEKKRGKPDPKKAAEAFRKREEKRKAKDEDTDEDEEDIEEDEDDKPLTRREAREILGQAEKIAQDIPALNHARSLAQGNEKAAQLIHLKWKNRTFPEGMPLAEQLEEVYAIVYRKRIMAQRDEAVRGLKNKNNVNRNAATTHHDPLPGKEPQYKGADAGAIKAAGFEWNSTKRRYEKKLSNGKTLYKDPKDGRVKQQ